MSSLVSEAESLKLFIRYVSCIIVDHQGQLRDANKQRLASRKLDRRNVFDKQVPAALEDWYLHQP